MNEEKKKLNPVAAVWKGGMYLTKS